MLYRWTRDLHLYFGLFVSPFLLLFAISVFFLNHAKVIPAEGMDRRAVRAVQVPADISQVRGSQAVAAARAMLKPLDIDGEIVSARFVRQTGHFAIAVSRPGLDVNVDVDVNQRLATVSTRAMGFWERLAYLHKMPGPHNVDIRGNWTPTVAWRAAADATIYITLFISLSGVYLWWALRAERRIGLAFLSLGVLTFLGCINALLH